MAKKVVKKPAKAAKKAAKPPKKALKKAPEMISRGRMGKVNPGRESCDS